MTLLICFKSDISVRLNIKFIYYIDYDRYISFQKKQKQENFRPCDRLIFGISEMKSLNYVFRQNPYSVSSNH